MERYLKIIQVNNKYCFRYYVIIALTMCIVAPFIIGTENLDQYQAAKVVEMYLSLLGIVLLIPIFSLEINKNIRDLVISKRESLVLLHIVRVIQACIYLVILGILFLAYLKSSNCQIIYIKMFYTYIANAIFLGGLGVLTFAITKQQVFSYMLPLVYYIICYGAGNKFLGKLYLFSMQFGNITEKHYLLTVGVTMLISAVLIFNINDKIKTNKKDAKVM